MKVYVMWYGGYSYSPPNQFDRRDVEEFTSIKAAVHEFEKRLNHPYYPCVEGPTEMQVFFYDPFEDGDAYPDRIIKMGPRGGIVVERV